MAEVPARVRGSVRDVRVLQRLPCRRHPQPQKQHQRKQAAALGQGHHRGWVSPEGNVRDTKHHLHLEACIRDMSLQLQFWLELDGGPISSHRLSSYSISADHGVDLGEMTHLGCRITLVKENVSRWSTWFFGKKHTGDFSSEIEFIGPKTPYTSSLACSVAKEKARVNELYLLHTKNPSRCRIVSETHHPKIKILSDVTLTVAYPRRISKT